MRDEKIDFLRFVGLSMIILAHSAPPSYIFQLRNFDVPLMVLVSGMSYKLTSDSKKESENYLSYIWKRVKRLVFPVWIFLTIFFLSMYFFNFPKKLPEAELILSSYTLLWGIGYVWIIRIFLMIAIISPYIYKFENKITSNLKYFGIMLGVYLLYEIYILISHTFSNSIVRNIFENTILYIAPFGFIFGIGLRIQKLTSKQVIFMMLVLFGIFLILLLMHFKIEHKIIQTQIHKYPPTLYYLSYALALSLLLFLLANPILQKIEQLEITKVVNFVSKNSIWIYLWHIVFIESINLPFYFKFPIVFCLAAFTTLIQVELITKQLLPKIESDSLRKNILQILTG